MILDTHGNIFGGFTPLTWEWRTRKPHRKIDRTLKSFLFTLKNPHNIPPRRFALKEWGEYEAIFCRSDRCSSFCDIRVVDYCNTNFESTTVTFGSCYNNDTGVDSRRFFTGSPNFQVKEIEVFEITA
jgi:hypothetical protein